MDRALPTSTRRRNRLRKVLTVVIPIALFTVAVAMLPNWLRPTLTRTRIRTATVTTGPLDQVITASGTVVPEIERVIASPVDARLLHVLRRPGAALRAGDAIVELDTSESRLAYQRLLTDVEVSDNQRAQTLVALEKALADLDGRIERKRLEAQLLDEKAASARRLSGEGLLSQQGLRDAELAAQQAHIELQQLSAERTYAQRSTDLQTAGLALQRAGLRRGADDARRVLDLATATSDRDGVLTHVLTQEGTLVRRGDVIARVADLRSFRVDGNVPDAHGGHIRTGIPVTIRAGEAQIPGRISEVSPAVDNGTVRFTVSLDQPSHSALRASLAVDTLVVTDRRAQVRKVKQGPYTDSTGSRGWVFVIRGDRAYRTDVTFGLRGFDELEVVSGLQKGDEVIISDMRDYQHLEEVRIR
jgi:HlyD family secretion protein